MGEDSVSNELTASNESNALMAVIERVAMSENADIAKLEKMLDMQERVLNRNAAQSFTADMAMMQGEMPRVFKLASGHNTTYARLEDINDTIRPVLQRFGFAVTFNIDQPTPKDVKVTAILSHRDGHKETSSLTLPCDTSGSKNAVQAVGSTISYGKRYSMCALLNISTGDDTNGFKLGDVQGEKPVGNNNLITEEQAAQLINFCGEKGVTTKQLCEKAGTQSVEEIPAHRFEAAKKWVLNHA
jgi:hypothetical protein